MMTSRAEYRLLLRQDNADLRLRKYGHQVGLVSDEVYEGVLEKQKKIEEEIERLKSIMLGAGSEICSYLESQGSAPLSTATSLASLLCRPELDYEKLAPLDPGRPGLPSDVTDQVQIEIRYEGYIKRQEKQVREQERLEVKKIPENIDYDDVQSLRIEARQHLKEFRPVSVGQASRISGVSPADISVLLVYLEKFNRQQ
jgi:tRNA uridine 5-carboxymethylaminomethyl modification enzyme